MSAPIGFLVWCPEYGLPTVVHDSFLKAVDEAARLKRLNPRKRFVVMSPVEDMSGVGYALGFTRGREQGLAQGHREIMDAEARADRIADEAAALRRAKPLLARARAFQSVVADCLTWFAGFEAAHLHKEGWERPWTPERDQLRDLNGALQSIASTDADFGDDIPF